MDVHVIRQSQPEKEKKYMVHTGYMPGMCSDIVDVMTSSGTLQSFWVLHPPCYECSLSEAPQGEEHEHMSNG